MYITQSSSYSIRSVCKTCQAVCMATDFHIDFMNKNVDSLWRRLHTHPRRRNLQCFMNGHAVMYMHGTLLYYSKACLVFYCTVQICIVHIVVTCLTLRSLCYTIFRCFISSFVLGVMCYCRIQINLVQIVILSRTCPLT